MELKFLHLVIKDFKSIAKAELKLDRLAGLHFVRGENLLEPRLGSNGAGKTTIFDALTWCLFGKTPGGLKGPDILPWVGGKPIVQVLLDTGDDRMAIERTYNPNSLSIGGTHCGQEEVDTFLRMNFDLFTNTIVLAQGRPLFFDLPPREKMQLFTDVLSLEKWEQRSETASESSRKLESLVAQAEATVKGLQGELETIDGLIIKMRRLSDEWKRDKETKLTKLQAEFQEFTTKLKEVESQYNEVSVKYDGVMTELKALQLKRRPRFDKLDKCSRIYGQAQSEIGRAELNLARLRRELQRLAEAKTCPTCGQPINADDVSEHKAELLSEIKTLEELVEKGIPEEIEKAYLNAKNDHDIGLSFEEEFQKKADALQTEVDYWTPELVRTQADLNRVSTALNELDKEDNPYREQVADLEQRKELLLEDIESGKAYVQLNKRKAERSKFWVKGFKDIRLFIIEEVLTELELASSIILEELGLVGWSIDYNIEKETKSGTIQRGINVTIHSPNNDSPVKWEAWSGGEGQRLRLVGALALSEVLLSYAGINTNLEILDEPTRHLSKEGIKDTWLYLADRAERLNRVCMYVDHQSVESARFASVITAVKGSKGTQILEE